MFSEKYARQKRRGTQGPILVHYRIDKRMASSFKLYTLPQVAEGLLLSKTTIKRLVRAGLLVPRYQILSGQCYRLVFLESELLRFISDYYPRPGDLGPPTGKPEGRRDRVEMIRRLRNLHQLYLGRVNAMRSAKECGLEGSEPEAQEEEPVILDHRPSRRQSALMADRTSRDEKSLGEDRDDEDGG